MMQLSSSPDPSVSTVAPEAGADATALVFGGGGVLGFAWTVGALSAWSDFHGVDPRTTGLTVGTSAGSIVAALLGCGIEVDVLRRHHQGVPTPADPSIEWNYDDDSGGPRPPLPGLRPGSPRLLLDAMRHPRSTAAGVALSGLLPTGRGDLRPIHDVIAEATLAGLPGLLWPSRPRTWVVATDYDSGRRAVFGRDDVPVALADAVSASCAIPAWYSPVEIGGRRYIDGGTASNASVDALLPLVADATIRQVHVFAPMAAFDYDRPRSPVTRVERVVRRAITRGILADADVLVNAGATVHVLTPGPEDLEIMGPNLMNPRRRSDVLATALVTAARALAAGTTRVPPAGPALDRSSPDAGPSAGMTP